MKTAVELVTEGVPKAVACSQHYIAVSCHANKGVWVWKSVDQGDGACLKNGSELEQVKLVFKDEEVDSFTGGQAAVCFGVSIYFIYFFVVTNVWTLTSFVAP